MFGIADDSVFSDFEQNELQDPCPRKELEDGRTIYTSRKLRMPKDLGAPILCDFGSAVLDDEEHSEDIQPISIEHRRSFWKFHGHIALIYGKWAAW